MNWIIFGVIAILFLILLMGFRIVRPIQRGLVERFGNYTRTCDPGLTWIIPFVDKMIKVNVTEINLDVTKQQVITKDNLNLDIDAVVYFRVTDPLKAVYKVNNYWSAIPSLAQTTLRSIIGEMFFTEVNAQRQTINTKIEQELDTQTQTWGIDILRVELQDVQPSREVQAAMDKVVTAEREKEAAVTRSLAEKESSKEIAEATVIRAEAEKRSSIERAEGDARAKILKAQAEAESIRMVNQAVEDTFRENAQKFKSLEVAENSLVNNSKIVLTEKGINPSLILNTEDAGGGVVPVRSRPVGS